MPIISLLEDEAFEPEHIRAMVEALDRVTRELGVTDRSSREILATRIIDLARKGERSAERLSERVLQEARLTDGVTNGPRPSPWRNQSQA
jgi:hypothetical protein